jgi:hypothetical protein
MTGPGARSAIQRTAGGEAAEALDQGIRAFRAGDLDAAHAAFGNAHRRAWYDARVASWYGLTLVLVEKNYSLGVLYADQAVRGAGPLPELALNQARVALALGQREQAVRALERGLADAPGDPGLAAARDALGRRGPPFLRFLPRNNPLNHWLGRLRHRLARHGDRAQRPTPQTLGATAPPGPRPSAEEGRHA